MNTDAHIHCIFRKIGSTSLVIFERDGLLLRRKRPSRHLLLGDINDEFVEILKQLRELKFRFGFISDQRGMDAGSHGKSEFVALTRALDKLLSIRGALPDFWIASRGLPQRRGTEFQYRNGRGQAPSIDVILRAMNWYGADKNSAIFVSGSPPGILAAKDANFTVIRYAGWKSDRATPGAPGVEAVPHASTSEITDVRSLRATIEQILEPDRRTTARRNGDL